MLTTLAAILKPAGKHVGMVMLSLLGLVLLVIAAYRWDLTAGLAATGLACWLLEARIDMEIRQRKADQDDGRG
ncbi:hypothetical protein ACFWIW_10725 [Amycolatopsis sp. NPDC058340]|uniref:hypothetical protein n=1 Tax=Amycolatopsis sp. NPDC058340 TaxID=3346453 RepID=UPI003646824B